MRSSSVIVAVPVTKSLWMSLAIDEETAREQAAKEFNVSEVLKDRVAVQREG